MKYYFHVHLSVFILVYPSAPGRSFRRYLQEGNASSTTAYAFTRNLQLRDTGADVRALQQYLNAHGFPVASSGVGSSANETTYFGPATYRALKRFQAAHSILSTGYFGPLTRQYVDSH